MTAEQIEKVEAGVNRAILSNMPLNIVTKSLAQATAEGAMALFLVRNMVKLSERLPLVKITPILMSYAVGRMLVKPEILAFS